MDDPEILVGRLMAVLVAAGFVCLIASTIRASVRRRSISLTDTCGMISAAGLLWFLTWIVTGGEVPHGLWGLAISALLLILMVTRHPPRTQR